MTMKYWEQANEGTQLVKLTLDLDRMGGPGARMLNNRPPYHPGEYAALAGNTAIQSLIGAEQARLKAKSYRNFRVGAAAMAYFYGPGGTRKLCISHGANVKPSEDSDINVHAEQMVMSAIESSRLPGERIHIPAMAVVGDLQPDQQSGRKTLTLHPCGVCREAFGAEDTPVDERTLFVAANIGMTAIEWFSLDALTKVHKDNDYSDVGQALFDVKSPILEPLDLTGRTYVSLSEFETPEWITAEREFDAKVKMPIFHYVYQMIAKNMV